MGKMQMPFGKHKGENIEDLPVDYMEWFCSSYEIHPNSSWAHKNTIKKLIEAMEEQLRAKRGEGI